MVNKTISTGEGNKCPKCKNPMQRRTHMPQLFIEIEHFYSQWDYCESCRHVQHYEEFKNKT